MPGAIQNGESGLAAEDVHVGPPTTGYPDGADKRDAVDDRDTTARGHDATAVGDDEALKPGLGHHLGCR